jgi:palmitoyl transferase
MKGLKRRILFFFVLCWAGLSPLLHAETNASTLKSSQCSVKNVIPSVRHKLSQIWNEGTPELYLTGYAWHNRYTYDANRVNLYNEFAAGGGLGKGWIDEDGDWHSLYAMAFLDSHSNIQPLAGYGYQKMFQLAKAARAGLGFTWFATQRQDIFHGIPFIGIPLPMISLSIVKASIFATYVPGSQNVGNVMFVFGKWTF